MSIDLGGTFTTVQGLLDQLLPTSGTSLDLARPGPDGHVNPVTLQPAAGGTTTLASGLTGIVVAEGRGQRADPFPGLERQEAIWRIITPDDAVQPAVGDVYTCTASRNGHLVGRSFLVIALADNSAGAVHIAAGRMLPTPAGV